MSGWFITFEGVEGCGKSTQAKLLSEYLHGRGDSVLLTREPGGTPLAEGIRDLLLSSSDCLMDPLTELFLFEAARAQHVAERIRPAMERGDIVICDRFADSTTAYQGAGRKLAYETVAMLNSLGANGVWPNWTVLIDVPAEEGLKRARGRGSDDRITNESLWFHQRIREAFLTLAHREPGRVTVVNGARPIAVIQEEIRRLAMERLSFTRS